jgi:hypothetical protein
LGSWLGAVGYEEVGLCFSDRGECFGNGSGRSSASRSRLRAFDLATCGTWRGRARCLCARWCRHLRGPLGSLVEPWQYVDGAPAIRSPFGGSPGLTKTTHNSPDKHFDGGTPTPTTRWSYVRPSLRCLVGTRYRREIKGGAGRSSLAATTFGHFSRAVSEAPRVADGTPRVAFVSMHSTRHGCRTVSLAMDRVPSSGPNP